MFGATCVTAAGEASGGERHEKWMNFQRKGTIYSETEIRRPGAGGGEGRGVTSSVCPCACVCVHMCGRMSAVDPCENRLGVSDLFEARGRCCTEVKVLLLGKFCRNKLRGSSLCQRRFLSSIFLQT